MPLGHFTEVDEDASIAVPKYLKRVDIAGGKDKKTGFTSIDICGGDITHDLNIYPWPLDDQSCFELHCAEFVEHVADLSLFMQECWRVLVPKGMLTILAPNYMSHRAIDNPKHLRVLAPSTFKYYGDLFKIESTRNILEPEWESRSPDAQNWARDHYWNVCKTFEVTLRRI